MNDDEFDDRLTALAERVSPKVEWMLTELGHRLSDVLVPSEVAREDRSWRLDLSLLGIDADDTDGLDVVLSLEPARDHSPSGPATGCAWHLTIASTDGRIIGGCTPYNYTEAVWASVDAHMEQNRRLGIVEDYLDCAEAEIRAWIEKEAG